MDFSIKFDIIKSGWSIVNIKAQGPVGVFFLILGTKICLGTYAFKIPMLKKKLQHEDSQEFSSILTVWLYKYVKSTISSFYDSLGTIGHESSKFVYFPAFPDNQVHRIIYFYSIASSGNGSQNLITVHWNLYSITVGIIYCFSLTYALTEVNDHYLLRY